MMASIRRLDAAETAQMRQSSPQAVPQISILIAVRRHPDRRATEWLIARPMPPRALFF